MGIPTKSLVIGVMLMFFAMTSSKAATSSKADEPQPDRKPAADAKSDTDEQGIRGKVVVMTGDFMPGTAPPSGKIEPISVPVHIFKGRVEVFSKPDPKRPQFVKTVQSGKDGSYEVALPPGEYTVVAEINGSLYLNSFEMPGDGKQYWGTVHVEAKQWKQWDIKDTSKATS